MDLPLEIQENILRYLDRETLFVAANVCNLWKELAKRLFWKLSMSDITDDCLTEILGSKELEKRFESQSWDDIYSSWYQGHVSNQLPVEINPITEVQSITCFCLSGDCIVIGDDCGHIVVHDATGRNVCVLDDVGSSVRNVVAMDVSRQGPYSMPVEELTVPSHTEHDVIVVLGTNYVRLYRLVNAEQPGISLFWFMDNLSTMLTASASTFGSVFSIAATPTELSMLEVAASGKVSVIDVLACRSRLWKWKLWKAQVICILATGEVSIWDRTSRTWLSVSERCSELFYQNPCFIFRGVVFCSSRTSQSLLEYWHCFPGESYWLLCWDGVTFHKYYPKLLMGEDVTAICLKRNVIALGTATGKLCLHKHTVADSSVAQVWESDPVAVVQLSQHAIRHCDISFEGKGLSVAARTKHELMVVRWSNKPGHVLSTFTST